MMKAMDSTSKMKVIIMVTGMSGTGKSTDLAELARRGHRVIDTDYDGWSENADDSGWLWREDRIDTLLNEHTEGTLFISGTVSNQGKFYPRFDAVKRSPGSTPRTCGFP